MSSQKSDDQKWSQTKATYVAWEQARRANNPEPAPAPVLAPAPAPRRRVVPAVLPAMRRAHSASSESDVVLSPFVLSPMVTPHGVRGAPPPALLPSGGLTPLLGVSSSFLSSSLSLPAVRGVPGPTLGVAPSQAQKRKAGTPSGGRGGGGGGGGGRRRTTQGVGIMLAIGWLVLCNASCLHCVSFAVMMLSRVCWLGRLSNLLIADHISRRSVQSRRV